MLRRLSVQTAGESHGGGMLAHVGGFPAGWRVDVEDVDAQLARRQAGFGRSPRQRIERDRVEFLAGLYRGCTTGAPLALRVRNVDDSLPDKPPLHRPRPGHADLAGGQKYDTEDMRPVLERASARETAARVAAGALAAQLLGALGIELLGAVVALGPVAARGAGPRQRLATQRAQRDRSPFHVLDHDVEDAMEAVVLEARSAGDTLGGVFEVVARGVPAGLGSLEGFATRLDARLGAAILSIQAIKAVEIGEGMAAARERGSSVHDPVLAPGPRGPRRASNRAGGVEGGMTNGEPVVVRGHMKPIATLARALPSYDFARGEVSDAFYERSDVTAVPAAAIVGEAMVALVLLDALLEKTGGDTVGEVRAALTRHRRGIAQRFGRGRRGAGRATR